jgi:hypothetical protein
MVILFFPFWFPILFAGWPEKDIQTRDFTKNEANNSEKTLLLHFIIVKKRKGCN